MHTRIILFHELRLPHLDGDRKGQWATFSEDDGMVYLLNDDRYELADLCEIDIHKDIHFESEAECHKQAHSYYSNYGKPYPYVKEWKASMTVVAFDDSVVIQSQSQVMEFI